MKETNELSKEEMEATIEKWEKELEKKCKDLTKYISSIPYSTKYKIMANLLKGFELVQKIESNLIVGGAYTHMYIGTKREGIAYVNECDKIMEEVHENTKIAFENVLMKAEQPVTDRNHLDE